MHRALRRRHGAPQQELPQRHDGSAGLPGGGREDPGALPLRRKREAIESVPDEYCDEASLVGPPERIRDRYREWEGSGATGLILSSIQPEAMELMADLTGSREQAAS